MCIFSVILLCHFALCSSWLCCVFTHATICTLCYHITFVVRWKDFWTWKKKKKKKEKKKEQGLSRSDYVLLYFMWICKMVTKMLIFDCERFKMGKNKRLLNLSMSFVNISLIKMPDESDTNTHTHTQIHLPFSHGRPTRWFTAQTTTYQSASTAQCEQTQPKKLHQFTKSSLMLPTGRVWIYM